jgi:hypothetical protein
MWKKIAESTDLISYEHRSRALTTRLEARLMPDKSWCIFKKYYNDEGVSFTEEYRARSKDEAQYLIDSLKSKLLDRHGVEQAKKVQNREIRIQVRRSFKDYSVEKWNFSVDGEGYNNFLYLRFEEGVQLDICIHAKYKIWETQIIGELMTIFGLAHHELDVNTSVLFFSERYNRLFKGRHSDLLLSRLEMSPPENE